MKISIVTAVRNSASTIADCLKSVASQTHIDMEHIVIDGGSTDGTLEIIQASENRITRLLSEPDSGIYNALNKGFSMCSGDLIGILHADDIFHDESVLKRVAAAMSSRQSDLCYGDLLYVSKVDVRKVIRMWRSQVYVPGMFLWGWMPAHPTVFVSRELMARVGGFQEQLRIAADYELMLRLFYTPEVRSQYIPYTITRMRIGGASNRSLRNILRKSSEDFRSLQMNGFGGFAWLIVLCKNLRKLTQFFIKS